MTLPSSSSLAPFATRRQCARRLNFSLGAGAAEIPGLIPAAPELIIAPMVEVSIDEIGRDLVAYLERVQAGETFIIIQAGKRVAEIKPARSPAAAVRPVRGRVRRARCF